MKKVVVFVSVFLLVLIVAGAQQKTKLKKEIINFKPHISSVTQKDYSTYMPGHVDIVLNGLRFPNPPNGHQIKVGDHLTNMSSPWNANQICGTLGASIEGGRTYPVYLVKTSTNEDVTNRVDYFLTHLLQLNTSTSELRPGNIVEITSCLKLGQKGTKIIKYANETVAATSWEDYKFKFRIPPDILVPSKYELHLENQGKIISNKLVITIR